MKKCKQGYYYCYKDKKCKRIPTGYRVGLGGYLRREHGDEKEDSENKNGNHSNGNGNGNGNSNGSSNGGGGGGVSEEWSDKYKKSIDCNNPKGFSQKAHCRGRKKVNEDKQIEKIVKQLRKSVKSHAKQADTLEKKMTEGTLHKWFKGSKSKDGKGGWVNVTTGGTCASDEPGEGVPKCVSRSKYESMTPAERRSASRRKKKKDKGQQSKRNAAKPTYVATDKPKKKMKKEETNMLEATYPSDFRNPDGSTRPVAKKKTGMPKAQVPPKKELDEAKDKKGKGSGTKDACYHKVKSRYSVWPSAYASGALVKCRKVGAANWGNKSEEMDYTSFAAIAKETQNKIRDKVFKKKEQEKKEDKKEEWAVNTAAEYLFNEGLNEDGVAIFIEELGLESFVKFVYELGEEVLTEAKFDRLPPVSKTGKKIADLKGGAKASSIKSKRKIRATLRQKVDDESKSKPGFASFSKKTSKVTSQSKKDNTSKAVASAKKQQPKKRGILDRVAGEVLKGMERHKKAMDAARETGKTISKAAKVGAKGAKEFGKGVKSGVETAGKVAKVAKKAVSESVQYSDWRDDFKAMEYEFINLIEPEPLVTKNQVFENIAPEPKLKPGSGLGGGKPVYPKGQEPKPTGAKLPKIKKVEEEVETISERGPRTKSSSRTGSSSEKPQRRLKSRRFERFGNPGRSDYLKARRAELDRMGVAANHADAPLVDEAKVETIDEAGKKCWKGYKKAGTQKLFGKTYNRCVKENEQIDEIAPVVAGAARVLGGQLLRKGATRAIAGGVAKGAAQGLVGGTIGAAGRIAGGGLNAIGGIGNAVGGVGNAVGGLSRKAAADQEKKNLETRKKLQATEEFVDEAKDETEIEEKKDPCWDTHKQVGMKKKGGKMVPNCVPKEEKQIGGGNLKKLSGKATKRVDADVDGDVDTKDMSSSETGEFVPSPCGKKKLKPKVRFEESEWRSDFGEDWQKVNKGDKTDGMSKKAVAAYRRENPGSKLKTAVTGKVKKGSKDAKRRKSFCARSKGQQDMHNIDCSKTPDKAICKARRRWKC